MLVSCIDYALDMTCIQSVSQCFIVCGVPPADIDSVDFGDHVPSLTSPTKLSRPRKYQSHSAKRLSTALKWKALLPELLPLYADLVVVRSATPFDIPDNHVPSKCSRMSCKQSPVILKVLCVYHTCEQQSRKNNLYLKVAPHFKDTRHVELFICNCCPAAKQLLQYGLFPCAPIVMGRLNWRGL